MLGIPGGLLVVSATWALLGFDAGEAAGVLNPGSNREAESPDSLKRSLMASEFAWQEPRAQGDPEWVFDLFTPPVVYYDETTGAFTVTPPGAAKVEEGGFPLELCSIEQAVYRYQLVAYAGVSGDYLLTLDDRVAHEDIYVAPGELIPETRIEVKSFEELRIVPEGLEPGTTEVFDLVGVCILHDRETGEEYRLVSGATCYAGDLVARFQCADGQLHALSSGESLESEGASYQLKSIDPDASRVLLHRISSSGDLLEERYLYINLDTQDSAAPIDPF